MKRVRRWVVPTLLLATCAGLAIAALSPRTQATAPPAAVMGRWLTESGNLEVEIGPCGPTLCGTVVAVLGNRSMEDPGRAMKSVDGRSPMGLGILTDLVATDDGSWTGNIYNRENGKTYDCRITPLAGGRLLVRGYKILPVVGKDQMWTRVLGARSAMRTQR